LVVKESNEVSHRGKQMKPLLKVLCALLAALLTQVSVSAQQQNQDQEFLIKAMRSGVAEVRLSEYAARHCSEERVRNYAEQLVRDHKDMNNLLAERSRQLNVAVVAGQEKATRDKLDRLSQFKGADLDLEYLKTMVSDHEEAIKLFQIEATAGVDPNLKSVAKSGLPALRKHLDEAKTLLSKFKK
jgi:putative membrane protein